MLRTLVPALCVTALIAATATAHAAEENRPRLGNESVGSVNAVVGETNDDSLDARRTPARRNSVATVSELRNDRMNGLFQAVAETTEEAILNSLLQARPMRSALRSVDALDPEVVRRSAR